MHWTHQINQRIVKVEVYHNKMLYYILRNKNAFKTILNNISLLKLRAIIIYVLTETNTHNKL